MVPSLATLAKGVSRTKAGKAHYESIVGLIHGFSSDSLPISPFFIQQCQYYLPEQHSYNRELQLVKMHTYMAFR